MSGDAVDGSPPPVPPEPPGPPEPPDGIDEDRPAEVVAAVVADVAAGPPPPPDLGLQVTPGAPTIRRLLLLIAATGLVLGTAALRDATLLGGRIDPDLVTTPDAALMDTIASGARLVLVVLLAGLVRAVRPWLRSVRGNLQALWELGVVGTTVKAWDGSVRRRPGARSPLVLTAAVRLPADRLWWATGVHESTRSAVVALGLGGIALALVVAGSVPLVVAERELASTIWFAVAIGGLLLAPASGALAWLVADIDRREAAAMCAAEPGRLSPPWPENRWAAAAIGALIAAAIALPLTLSARDEERACVDSALECRWMIVQADQIANDPRGATTELHYGLRRATGTRRGTMVLVAGGPGLSGMASSASTFESLDPRLTEAFDLVVFDARGVGGSGYRDCPEASVVYGERIAFDAADSVIGDYVTSCLLEAGVDHDRLSMYASAQIAEDIDTIRRDLGLERIVLYGESYGTAIGQRYALAHPDRLDALILDAPLDIAESTDGTWTEAAASFENVLDRSFDHCQSDTLCSDQLPDPATAWDRVIARLHDEPVTVRYADSTGSMTSWEVREDDTIGVLGDLLYDGTGRMQMLRALAGADKGDWVPLARLIHSGSPGESDGSSSDFTYVATFCADRVVDEEDAPDIRSYLEVARHSAMRFARLGSVYLSGAACHGWPLAAASPPPATLPSSARFPVFILTATGDPITPPIMGRRIAARYGTTTDVYLIETTDGPHVTFGRGESCPDDTIVAYLVDGSLPLIKELHCGGDLVYPYIGLVNDEPDQDGATYRARALDAELLTHPDYLYWDGTDELALGCRFGGRMIVTSNESSDHIDVEDCAVVDSGAMNGTGEYRDDGTVEFDVTFGRGAFRYQLDAEGGWTVRGTFDGEPIAESG